MEKELGRCAKIERALEVMYKMYFARDASNKQALKELNATTEKLLLDRDVYRTFQMLEGRSVAGRFSDLRRSLERQQQREAALQQRYFELTQELKGITK